MSRKRNINDVWYVLLAIALLAAWIAYNAAAYRDWTCAFSRCVKVSSVKP